MKKLLFIIFLTAISLTGFSQDNSKHLIYTDSVSYQFRLYKLTYDAILLWNDNITERYCNIHKHPTKDLWEIPIDIKYISIFTQEEIDNAIPLDSTWFPVMPFPIK